MIWLFRSKPVQDEPNPDELRLARAKQWRALGASFTYVGNRCYVTSHGFTRLYPRLGRITHAQLSADYRDENGVIRSITIAGEQLDALMDGQP